MEPVVQAGLGPQWQLHEKTVATYSLAILIAIAAIILRLWMSPYIGSAPFIVFFPAVVVSTYVCGQRPGLLTALLCGLAAWYFILPPYASFRPGKLEHTVQLLTYFGTSALIALIVGRMRSAIAIQATTRDALAASEAQFKLLADSSPALIWVTDEDARVTFANRRYEEVFGRPAGDIEGEGWRQIVHPEDVDTFNARFLAALSARDRFSGDLRVYDRNGRVMWLHCEGVPRFGPDGGFYGYVGANLDVTEGVTAQKQLAELNALLAGQVVEANAERKAFADIVENSSAAIMAIDVDFNIVAANAAAIQSFDRLHGKQAKIGKNLLEIFDGDAAEQTAAQQTWGRAFAGEEFIVIEEFGRSEQRIVHEARYNIRRGRDGEIIGVVRTANDVTERIRAQRELEATQNALRQSQKMESMGQLTGGVAHDFNNLLTPIIGVLDLLRRRATLSEQHLRLVDGALQSSDRARLLVQRLLAFARQQPLQPVPLDVTALVEGMTELLKSTLGPQIDVILDLPPALPTVLADTNQLEMAILNLAVNARDAMPEGGKLSILCFEESIDGDEIAPLAPGEYVCLAVRDTGVGMDEATLAKAAEPFFSTKGIGEGTGLGLSMVHGLAQQLGGALVIDSKLGQGTSIELWLPVSRSDHAVEIVSAASAAIPGSGTVLLVDDEEMVRLTTADLLADLGYDVVEACSAEDALQQMDNGLRFNLLVTDQVMPGMRGTELAAIVDARWPGTPVILVSGYADLEDLPPTLPRLAKPFRQSELASAIERLLTSGNG